MSSYEGSTRPWSLVSGPWSLVRGLLSLVPDPRSLVPGPWDLVPGLWSVAPGPWSLKYVVEARGVREHKTINVIICFPNPHGIGVLITMIRQPLPFKSLDQPLPFKSLGCLLPNTVLSKNILEYSEPEELGMRHQSNDRTFPPIAHDLV